MKISWIVLTIIILVYQIFSLKCTKANLCLPKGSSAPANSFLHYNFLTMFSYLLTLQDRFLFLYIQSFIPVYLKSRNPLHSLFSLSPFFSNVITMLFVSIHLQLPHFQTFLNLPNVLSFSYTHLYSINYIQYLYPQHYHPLKINFCICAAYFTILETL